MWLQLNPPIQNPPKPTANVTMATTAAWLHPANWTQHRRMAGKSKPRSNRQKVKQLHLTPISIQTLFSQLINKYMYHAGSRLCSHQTPSKTTITVQFEWYYKHLALWIINEFSLGNKGWLHIIQTAGVDHFPGVCCGQVLMFPYVVSKLSRDCLASPTN